MNLLQEFEKDQQNKLLANKAIPSFRAGDVIRVDVRIVEGSAEGTTERIQAYEGLCIAKRSRGMGSTFTVRKISDGEGVERSFPLYSPKIEKIVLVKKGIVRKAKLYYMRKLRGKAARIREKKD
jgi:large subunit ribosomal protein L19